MADTLPTGRSLRYMACDDIADYLASLGISAQGVTAIRENQVDGEVFMELTENDIKDLFVIFKDRHLVRKVLQGKDNIPLKQTQAPRDSDYVHKAITKQGSGASGTSLRTESSARAATSACVKTEDQQKLFQSYSNFFPRQTDKSHRTSTRTSQEDESFSNDQSIDLTQSPNFEYSNEKSIDLTTKKSNHERNQNICIQPRSIFISHESNMVAIDERQKPSFHSAISNFLHNRSQLVEIKSEPPSDSSLWNIECSVEDDNEDPQLVPSILSYRATQFSGQELLSRKPKQGKPNEAQRLGQMVVREASARAGIWDDPPCLLLLSAKQKHLFFEYCFMMAPNLREFKDLLWKRLGEALLNRRKYLRDKVSGKRGKRTDELDVDGESLDSQEGADELDQIPDTSTSPLHRGEEHRRSYRLPSSTVSRYDVEDTALVIDCYDSAEEDDAKQAYPDSTMDSQQLHDYEHKNIAAECEVSRRKRPFYDSSSQNLSLLSSAACSALLKEEGPSYHGYRAEMKQRRVSDSWADVADDAAAAESGHPPQDIEKVNLHKRLFQSKHDSSKYHHNNRKNDQIRKPSLPVFEPTSVTAVNDPLQSPHDNESPQDVSDVSSEPRSSHGRWDSMGFVMEELPHVKIYSTIDRVIANYTGEELLGKKSKQGKPSEPQRLGQQVIREAAMMAKIWQDVPQSIRSVSEEQKKAFFHFAFTLAPNLVSYRDMLWRRLGEALQNRRKYVRDRSLGKRPTKREQRLMKESLQRHQQMELDSHASLSSIHDIEDTVRIKSEYPDTSYSYSRH